MPIRWTTPSTWTASTIAINSIADGTTAISTSVIANGTGLDLYMDVSLRLGSITPGTAPAIELHLSMLLDDGTTYSDVAASGASVVSVLPTTITTGAKSIFFGPPRSQIIIPPGSYKLAITNRTGTTLAATGNALAYRLYSVG